MWLGVKREDLVKAGGQGAATRTTRTPAPWCRVRRATPSCTRHRSSARQWPPAPRPLYWPAGAAASTPRQLVKASAGAGQTHLRESAARAARQAVRARALQRRRDLVQELQQGRAAWHRGIVAACARCCCPACRRSRPARSAAARRSGAADAGRRRHDRARDRHSRLALAIMDRASWEFADLRSRIAHLEGRERARPARHAARPRAGAHRRRRLARAPGCTLRGWRELQRCCTTSSRCWSRRPTTRPTAGWSSRACCPRSTCGLHPPLAHGPATDQRLRRRGRWRGGASGHSAAVQASATGMRRRGADRRFGSAAAAGSGRRRRHRAWPARASGTGGQPAAAPARLPGPRRRRDETRHDDAHHAAGAQRRTCRGGARPAQPAGRTARARSSPARRQAVRAVAGAGRAINQAQQGIRQRVGAATTRGRRADRHDAGRWSRSCTSASRC